MKEIILASKTNTHSAWTNYMTYEEWFVHFKEKSESFKLFKPKLKGTEISEKQIILVLDFLKHNYKDLFTTVTDISRPNMAVEKKCKIENLDPEITKNVYDIIERWENSKK